MTPPRKSSPSPSRRPPIIAERVRSIDGGFAFVPHRFLHDGFLASLNHDERSLYFLLVLAGDRNGVSFYRYDSICSTLECTLEAYIEARNGLIEKDLLAFDGTRFQVLSLPARPVWRRSQSLSSATDLEANDPATIRHLLTGDTTK